MYEKTYGSKYDRNLDTAEIAKRIREDIKAATKAGELPKGLKVSVKTRRFSGGSSIDVSIKSLPCALLNVARVEHEASEPNKFVAEFQMPRYTNAAKAVLETLKKIHGAYNFDGSDIQTDYFNVNYYGSVDVHWDAEQAERAKIVEALRKVGRVA